MSKTLQQIIDAAEQIAVGMGGDPNQSAVIDSEMTAEDLLPLVVIHTYKELARKSENFTELAGAFEIDLTNGVGEMPRGVLQEHLDKSYLSDQPYSAYMNFTDYSRSRLDNQLTYYAVRDNAFYYSDAAAESVNLIAPALPDLSDDPFDELNLTPRIENAVIYNLALALRGDLKLERLM